MKYIQKIFGILLIGLMIVCPIGTAFAETNGNTTLSIQEGSKIASFYAQELSKTIPELVEWGESTVEHEITYYDFDGDISAYAFNVIENNAYQGYILVSATRDNYPILEFSKGKLPHMMSKTLDESHSNAQKYATENKLSIGDGIPIYGGATFYYEEYEIKGERNKMGNKIIVDLSTQRIIEVESSGFLEEFDTLKAQEVLDAWNYVDDEMTKNEYSKTLPITRSSIGYIYDVPFEYWYLGCSPTAASMVLEYWYENGYSNLPYGDTLIEDLADAMNTGLGGNTSISMIDDGIEDVCPDNGYTNFNAINDDNLFMSETMNEIDADRPFVLTMINGGIGSGHTNPYNDHSAACVGYSEGTTDYLFLHDTWDDEHHHYITFGNWDDATATWVRP
jgi:hypothetical protein